MHSKFWTASVAMAVVVAAIGGAAQQAAPPAQGAAPAGRGGGGGRGNVGPGFFTAVDTDKDGAVTRAEMKATFERWFGQWDAAGTGALTQEQLLAGMAAALPQPAPGGFGGGGRGAPAAQNQTPQPQHVEAMMAALPASAPARPKQPRRVLVLAKAAGFVHSSIPLAARTVEEMGKKTGAWATTITYDPADINEQNLKQYDAIFLDSTTGAFLDDPNDAAATAARRKAFLEFVRGGKGLAGIHAATDSYHQNAPNPSADPVAAAGRAAGAAAGARGGRGGGQAAGLVTQFLAQGDKNSDQKLSREEFTALSDAWYDKLDAGGAGRISQADFPQRFAVLMPAPAPPAAPAGGGNGQAPATQLGPDTQVGTWPEFNKMIGGFFKFHWNDGQPIHYKIDDPNNPINKPFKGLNDYVVVDETYTMGRDTYSRQNLRVLTSIDYGKMSAEDKAKETNPRGDGDYALSWIRREGKGRVFYEAHGHNEKIYAMKPLLEHVLYGMQYVLGDLQADDSPSVKGGTR
jgi:type 1 glutamine amidotransferase